MIIDIVKVFAPTALTFFIGLLITPLLTHFLYKHKLWKKQSVTKTTDGKDAPISQSLHKDEKIKVPRMGGIVIWLSTLITLILFWIISEATTSLFAEKLNFFSRNQTWLPVFTLLIGAFVGLISDYFDVSNTGNLSPKKRLLIVSLIGFVGGWWFFAKLGVVSIIIPFVGMVSIGWLIIPLFILVMLGTYSGGVIDGIDGLAGGVFAIIFGTYGIIAFLQQQIDLATFSFVLAGGILAFLWFNIPPARFYMSETGTMALTLTLTVIAFLTQQVLVLPVIAFALVLSSLSSTIQLLSKRFRNGKKVFIVAPLHNHFQMLGWPGYKVTMRYWVATVIVSLLGLVIVLMG